MQRVHPPSSPAARVRRATTGAAAALLLCLGTASPGMPASRPRPATSLAGQPADTGPVQRVVAVFGDGYAEALVEGLRADGAGQSGPSILQATHAPSGLADASRFDWSQAVRDLLAQQHVDIGVVMLGANDREPLPDGDGLAAPLSPRWRALYAERVRSLAELFRSAGVPLVWVGLPIVADEALSATYVALNEITRDATRATGGTYVDAWNAFADEAGRFSAFGPDAKGRVVRLRAGDGQDLTRAGTVKLAGFVEAQIRALAAAAPAAEAPDLVLAKSPDFDQALDVDINAQIRREAGLQALPGAGTGKTERGPIIALTAPPLAEGGRLVAPASDPAPLIGAGGSLAERVLVEGLPIQPRAGRADDFSWPRP